MVTSKHYIPYNQFILRTPLLSLSLMKERDDKFNSEIFKEAVFIASPDLAIGNQSTDSKKQKKYKESILKYHHRACTRCTPFGLFAGCSVGNLGEHNYIEMAASDKIQRCTRLDMQYLCALIQALEHNPQIRSQLKFYPNDSLYTIGGKYRYIEYHYKKSQRQHNVVSAEIDEALELLLSTSVNGATIDELSALLVDEQNTQEEAAEYVNEVIDSQILKSELDPAVVGDDVLTTLIDKLSKLKNIHVLGALVRIQDLLRKIDSEPIGTTLSIYEQIINLIKQIGVDYEAKYLFQADMYKPVVAATISTKITNKINRLVDFLTKISVPGQNTTLTNFTAAFKNRYEEQEIPLALALDGELGIGYPVSSGGENDISPLVNNLAMPGQASYVFETKLTPLDRVLFRKFIDSVRNNSSQVVLTDNDFKDISFTHELPDTTAVMCSIVNDNQLYIKSIGGVCGVALLGRFCHLDPAILEISKAVADFEAEKHPDAIIAEIAHLPESRIGNIASRPAFREYSVHYLSNYNREAQEISISDLRLSIRNGQLFLRSHKYNKEVIPRLTCAHNYSMSPIPFYRFLCDLQHQGITTGVHCAWSNLLSGQEYLPRILYDDIILCRQRWRITEEDIEGFDKMEDEKLIAAVVSLVERKHMPNKVIIPDSDNELYLDLKNLQCVRLLLTSIRQRKGITLEEFLFEEKNALVHQADTSFANELIFVFHK